MIVQKIDFFLKNTLFDFLFFSFVVVSHCCFLFFFPVVSVRFRFLVRRVHSSRSLIRFFFAICAVVLGRLMLNPEGSCRCHCANLPNYVNGTRNDRRRKATFWFVSSLFLCCLLGNDLSFGFPYKCP